MNTITLISGPPGSGKSTVSKLVAQHFPRCLVVSVDHLREMMVTGLSTPADGITEEFCLQFSMARSTAITMAQLYAGHGVDVIIDDVCVPSMFADHYATLEVGPHTRKILLMPNLETQTERTKGRGGPWDHILVHRLPMIYEYLEPMSKEGWIVLDSSDWTIDRTVAEVLAVLDVDIAK